MNAAGAHLQALANHGAESVKSLGHRPTNMKCSGCALDMNIPATTWQWKCTNGHVNEYGDNQCSVESCHLQRTGSISWPAMLCDHCGTVTTVPGSEAAATFTGGYSQLRATLQGWIHPPRYFHCEHCQTTIVVPQGPWSCQACTQVNTADASKCVRCSQQHADQRVLCGHCHKATAVPQSGLADTVKSGLSSFSRFANKAMMDLSGQPNVPCPTCQHAVKLPAHITTPASAAGTSAANTSSANTVAPVAPVAGQPAAASAGLPANEWNLPLTCPNCKHEFTLQRGGASAVSGDSSAAGAGGVAASGTTVATGRNVDMQVALVAPPGASTIADSSTAASN